MAIGLMRCADSRPLRLGAVAVLLFLGASAPALQAVAAAVTAAVVARQSGCEARDNLDENLVSRNKDDRGIPVSKQAGRES